MHNENDLSASLVVQINMKLRAKPSLVEDLQFAPDFGVAGTELLGDFKGELRTEAAVDASTAAHPEHPDGNRPFVVQVEDDFALVPHDTLGHFDAGSSLHRFLGLPRRGCNMGVRKSRQ